VRWHRVEYTSFAAGAALWALGTVAVGLVTSGLDLSTEWLGPILLTALVSWLCAEISGSAFKGELARRPYFVRIAAAFAGVAVLRIAIVVLMVVMRDTAGLTTGSVTQTIVFGVSLTQSWTWDTVARLVVGIAIPAGVIALVDWRYRRRRTRRGAEGHSTLPVGVEQRHRADGAR